MSSCRRGLLFDQKKTTSTPHAHHTTCIHSHQHIHTPTGREALDKFIQHFWQLVRNMSRDRMVTDYFWDLKAFVRETLERPQLLESDLHVQRSKQLMKQGQYVLSCCAEREQLDRVIDEVLYVFIVSVSSFVRFVLFFFLVKKKSTCPMPS